MRWDIINRFIKERGYKNYLEIGVYLGQCIKKVEAENKTAVDPGTEGGVAAEVTHKMTSNEFFESIKDTDIKYDIIFIDGLHHSYQVDEDIENSLKHLVDGGVIVVHDCNPDREEYTTVPRTTGIWHGDVYKSILSFILKGEHTAFTVDIDCGCGVIFKDYKVSSNISKEEYEKAMSSWDYFYENKSKLLNLISLEEFNKTEYK